jgi:hypothetical protein
MEFPKYSVWKETGIVALGQTICVAVMVGVFALLGKYDISVLLGGIVGGILGIAYFLSMVICANIATKKALAQDVKGGQALMQTSYMLRMVGLFGALVLCALTKRFHLLALVLPIVFVRPIVGIADLLKRKGEKKE